MKRNKSLEKLILFIIGCFFLWIIINEKIIYPKINKDIQENIKHYNKIQFKGSVVKIYPIERGGRVDGVMCVSLDYSNIQKFYRFDDYHCLKIENGIAVLPTGPLGNTDDDRVKGILKSKYLEVNMEGNGKMYFYDENGKIMIEDLYYRNNNLKESDMSICKK